MNEPLRLELLERYRKQHEMTIKGSVDPSLWDYDLPRRDTAFLKEVVKRDGWPKISEVGQDGEQAAWQLLQLADDDLPFQIHCLSLMKTLPDTEVKVFNIAYMEDRVLVRQGKSQVYGTQDGEIKDIANLDKRRKAMGLVPYAVQQKQVADEWQRYGPRDQIEPLVQADGQVVL